MVDLVDHKEVLLQQPDKHLLQNENPCKPQLLNKTTILLEQHKEHGLTANCRLQCNRRKNKQQMEHTEEVLLLDKSHRIMQEQQLVMLLVCLPISPCRNLK